MQRVEVRGEARTLPYSSVAATAEPMVSEGIATEDEVQEALRGLLALADDGATVIGSPRLFQAWTRRAPG